jgi:hypothetical protein
MTCSRNAESVWFANAADQQPLAGVTASSGSFTLEIQDPLFGLPINPLLPPTEYLRVQIERRDIPGCR